MRLEIRRQLTFSTLQAAFKHKSHGKLNQLRTVSASHSKHSGTATARLGLSEPPIGRNTSQHNRAPQQSLSRLETISAAKQQLFRSEPNMFSGLQLAIVTLLALIAISQPALAANRRFLRDIDTTSPVQLLQSSVSELTDAAKNIHGRLLQQVTGQRGSMAATGRATGAGETARPANAQPLSGTSTSGTVGTGGSNEPLAATTSLRSTTGGTSTLVGAAGGNTGTAPGRVSIDGTQSDAALAGSSMRSVTNGNAGYVGNNNAGTVSTESGMNGPRSEGTVAADVMPSATNQGGGVRPGGDGNLAMESMPSSGSAMSMRSEP